MNVNKIKNPYKLNIYRDLGDFYIPNVLEVGIEPTLPKELDFESLVI
jgi:hypothetical protein